METKDIQRRDPKKVSISIRTFRSHSIWLRENNISPTALFNKAVEELMEK